MCGIAGILNLADAPPPEESTLRGMLGMLRHRGPDQYGLYLGDQMALGNARLSIIDLGGGQQPISNEDGRLWIVFNGEIFNYVELRAELEQRGHRFATHSDTEVILHLYEDYGPECLNRMNGQWAIAIWDERQQSLLLARDRLGVRPLFHTRANGRLRFASEIKALLADPSLPREIDPAGLTQVFTYWCTLSPQTVFRGIQELPPGHYLLASRDNFVVRPYWQLDYGSAAYRDTPFSSESKVPATASASELREEDYLEAFRSLLTDAVRIRLRADVPVGAYLSGGLDSSAIAGLISQLGVTHLDTFSIAFSDPQFDESEHQLRMARFLGTDHQVVRATHEDIGRVFPDVVWHCEVPVMRTAPAPMFMLSKLVRERNYKVVLTGEGADEFLAGYDIFKEAKVRRFWASQPGSRWRPKLLQRLYPDIADLSAAGGAYLSAFFGTGLSDTDAFDYSHAVRWRNNRRTHRFFSEALQDPGPASDSGAGGGPLEAARWGDLEKAQYLETSIFLSHYLLSSQGDRMAMAHSVEGRYPFLDCRVVEFCNRLPARLKLKALQDKYLLRRLSARFLPNDIARRVKRPYRAPIQRSFFNPACQAYVQELLSPENVARSEIFKPAAVAQLLAKVRQNKPLGETDNMALVGIISTQLLHRLFVVDFRTVAPLTEKDDVKVVDRKSPVASGKHVAAGF